MKSTLSVLIAALLITSTAAFSFVGQQVQMNAPVVNARKGQMEMRARNCDLLGKTPNRKAMAVSFSHHRTHKVQEVNLQRKRYTSEKLGRTVRLRLSTKGIKTVNKYGSIDAAAEKFGLDLSKF